MNLEESDSYRDQIEKNSRNRKGVMLSIVLCALMIVLLFAMIIVIKRKDAVTVKLFLNGAQIGIPANFTTEIENEVYVNINQWAALLGYSYTPGVYGEYNDDRDSCYLQNDMELITITAGADNYKKYIQFEGPVTIAEMSVMPKNENGYYETFVIEKPIIYDEQTGCLFMSLDYAKDMFNINYDWKEYRRYIYTLDYIVGSAKGVVGQKYSEISGYYENMRATLYGYAIVKSDIAEDSYGLISLSTGAELKNAKYENIVFIQNSKEFYIMASNGTMGIIDAEGREVVPLSEYDSIELVYDKDDEKYYKVKSKNEYGLINKRGDIIFYPEFKELGYNAEAFKLEKIDNEIVYFGKCIPVYTAGKYGLYTVDGTLSLECVYDGFGYVANNTGKNGSNSTMEQNVLIIPESEGIRGIVINYNDKYGIYDVDKQELIIPTSFDKIYALTKAGETTYYLEYNEQQIVLSEFLEENNLITKSKSKKVAEQKEIEDDAETDDEIENQEN